MRTAPAHPPKPSASAWAQAQAWLRACVLVAVLAPTALGEAPPPEAQLGVEWVTARTEVFEGEVIHLALHLRVNEWWLARHGVPFARQPMDLPLRLQAPALRSSARLTWVDWMFDPVGVAASFALNDEVVADARWRGTTEVGPGKGEPARTVDRWLAIRRAFHVRGTGPLVLEAPEVDMVWAPSFQAGLLGERLPVEPRGAKVRGAALTLNVVPLPEAGRPSEFEGLIGRYTLASEAHPTRLAPGETLKVTLTIDGEGNHAALTARRLTPPAGMHVTGRLERRTPRGWEVLLELEPGPGTTSASVSFALDVFDPELRAYVRVLSPPQDVQVTTQPSATPTATPSPGPSTPPAAPAAPTGQDVPAWRLWLGIAALALILGLAGRRRRRESQAAEREEDAANALTQALEHLTETAGTPASGQALVEVLALQLGVPPAGVIAPDLAQRLVRTGLAEDLAGQAARAVEAWVAARYAGPTASQDGPVDQELARRLAAALAPPAA